MLSAWVFMSFFGPVYSHQIFLKNALASPTLAQMAQKDWISLPFSIMLNGLRSAVLMPLGVQLTVVAMLRMMYTAAGDYISRSHNSALFSNSCPFDGTCAELLRQV
jgi:hypothetical protein